MSFAHRPPSPGQRAAAAGLRITLRALATAALLAASGAAKATDAPPVARAALTARACAAHPDPYPADTPLADSYARLRQTQQQGLPVALEVACRAWRQVQRDHQVDNPADTVLQLDWQANVAATLVWLRRSAEAEPLLAQVFTAYQAAGPAQGAKAGAVAGMLAFIHVQRAQPVQALQWSQQAVDALQTASDGVTASDRLRVRLNHASMLSSERRFDAARNSLERLLAEAQAQPETLAAEAAAALGGLAMLARRQSRWDEALAFTDREIEWRAARVPQDPVNLVNAMQNRGLLLTSLARHDEAEAALLTALARAQQAEAAGGVDLFGHQVALRESLSALQLARGRPAEARRTAAEAVQRMAALPEAGSPRGARPLRGLADAQLALGELADGIATYQRAAALLKAGGRPADADTVHLVHLSRARALLEVGDLDEAAAALQEAAADPRPFSPDERARQQALLAALALRRGDEAGALAAWAAADTALATSLGPRHPQRQVLAAQRCELQASLCSGLAAARDDGTDGTNPADATDSSGAADDDAAAAAPEAEALVQLSLARRARADGDTAAAQRAARRALAAAQAAGQPRLHWPAYALLADLQADAGQRNAAIFFGKLALASVQQQRERLLPLGAVADARYLADKASLYRRVAEWLLQAQRIPEALLLMDLMKQHEQGEYQQRGAPAAGERRADRAAGVDLSFTEQAALAQLEAGTDLAGRAELQRLVALAAAQRISAEERRRLGQLQQAQAAASGAHLARLDAALALLQASPAAARGTLVATALRPAPGSLHVHLLAGEQQLSLLLTGRRGSQLQQLPLPAAGLALQIAQLRDRLQAPPGAGAAADETSGLRLLSQQLHAALGQRIDTAARAEGARRLVLWLDGPLRYLPLGLLHDGQQYLAQRYQLVVVGPSAVQPARVLPSGPGTLAAFGVTRALQGLPALPAVADEVCDIVAGPVLGLEPSPDNPGSCGPGGAGQGPLPGSGRLNTHFTAASLAAAARDGGAGQLLHIGTHFVLRPGQVSKSWLLLGDGDRLPLPQLRQIALGAPRLVTLSACDTAVAGGGGGGREVDGLAAALLDDGARQVLASLWRVDDRATARFMQRFYSAYVRERGDAAAALQAAQRASLATGAPAQHWAAFVLMAPPPRASPR